MTYEKIKWKTPGLFKADPGEVYEELKTLDERTPDSVVELAKDEDSVLHDLFDWDDEVAANKWRKQQARIIICNLVIEEQDTKNEEPVQLRVFHMKDNRESYEEVKFFVAHEDEYVKLLASAKRDLESFKAKYRTLKELKQLFEEAIEEL